MADQRLAVDCIRGVQEYPRRGTRFGLADKSELEGRSLYGMTTRSQARENFANGILITSNIILRPLEISALRTSFMNRRLQSVSKIF